MTYPAAITTYTPKTNGVDNVAAVDINTAYTDITAIETELGTDPAGSATDVKTRLAKSLSAGGFLNFATATELTITSGAVTAVQNFHTIDTESNAASDDLDTINGGADGLYLFFRANHTDRTVIVKHNTGNILSANGADITLDATNKVAFGVYDGTLSKWLISSGGGAGSGTLAGAGAATYVGVFDDSTTINGTDALILESGALTVKSNNSAIWLDGDAADFGIELDNTNGGAATNSLLRMPFGLTTKVDVSDVSDPPTSAEIAAAFGAAQEGFVGILDDADAETKCYLCWSDGTAWFWALGTKAL